MADRDQLLLADMLDRAELAVGYLDGVSIAAYRKDRQLQLAMERLLETLGEAAGRVSAKAQEAVDVDWKGLRGLRNVLAHQYDAVDQDILYAAVKKRLPATVKALRKAVGPRGGT